MAGVIWVGEAYFAAHPYRALMAQGTAITPVLSLIELPVPRLTAPPALPAEAPSAYVVITRQASADDQQLALSHGALAVIDLDQGAELAVARINRLLAMIGQYAESGETDPLTGLANRRRLQSVLGRRLADLKNGAVAVLFVDLHRFKEINDTLGHGFGDRLLRHLAEQMKATVGPEHLLCRYGGDEFVIVTPPLVAAELAARQLAIRVLALLEQPIELEGRTLYVGASAGIALAPEHGRTVQELVRHADVAMFESKGRGTGDVMLFSAAMGEARRYRLELEGRFRRALRLQQFVLHFQPVLDMVSGQVRSVEALLRWDEPELGTIAPGDFLAMAEQCGLMQQLGRQVVEMVFAEQKRWQALGLELPMAINLSLRQLADPEFLRHILATAAHHNLGLSRLQLEITEGSLAQDTEARLALLRELQKRGARISLDDFGCGVSSWDTLARLPASIMKIDRGLVAAMVERDPAREVVNSLVQLARTLGKQVVAEGVETEEQRSLLVCLGCELGQGFLFAYPMPGDVFVDWYREMTDDGRLISVEPMDDGNVPENV